MNTEKLNHWLSLTANIGVLIGIILLVQEINQSNQIANRDSRVDILNAGNGLDQATLENPDLAVLRNKLRSSNPELSDSEKEQARSIAGTYMTGWSTINVSSQTGFIPEENLQAYFSGAASTIRAYPGIAPFVAEILQSFNIQPGGFAAIYDVLWKEISELEGSR